MKKLLIASLLAFTTVSVSAHEGYGYRHGGGHYVYRDGAGWVLPAIVGGIVTYELTRPRPPEVIYVPQPQIPPPPAPVSNAPYGYHWEAILDARCNCYRTVLAPN